MENNNVRNGVECWRIWCRYYSSTWPNLQISLRKDWLETKACGRTSYPKGVLERTCLQNFPFYLIHPPSCYPRIHSRTGYHPWTNWSLPHVRSLRLCRFFLRNRISITGSQWDRIEEIGSNLLVYNWIRHVPWWQRTKESIRRWNHEQFWWVGILRLRQTLIQAI